MYRLTLLCAILLVSLTSLGGQYPELIQKGTWNRGAYLESAPTADGHLVSLFKNGLDILKPQLDGPIEPIGRISFGMDQPHTMVVNQQTAFVLTSDKLLIIDISTPHSPSRLAEMKLQAHGAYLQGTSLYLFGQSLTHLDVQQPSDPLILFQAQQEVTLTHGLWVESKLVTVNLQGQIVVFQNQADQTWSALPISNEEQGGPASGIVQKKRLLYVSLGQKIHAYQLQENGEVLWLDQFETDAPILDLDLYEDYLVVSRNLPTTAFVKHGTEDSPFNGLIQLPIANLESTTPIDEDFFFAVSQERGLEQFRPSLSFRKTTALAPGRTIYDVAFKDPYAFLATEGSLEVLSFATSQPTLIATYDLPYSIHQKLVYQDNLLHLINGFDYQRYQVESDGRLTKEYSQRVSISPDSILDVQVLPDRILLGTRSLLYVITSEGEEAYDISPLFFGPFGQSVEIVIDAPYLLVRNDYILDIYQLSEQGKPTRLTTEYLNQSEGPLPHPITYTGNLLISGPEVFDARRMDRLREYSQTSLNLDDAFLDDGFLYGVGPEGLQIWNFEKPESPTKVWAMPNMSADQLFEENNRILVFNEDPQWLAYFTNRHDDEGSFFPFLQNDPLANEQLIFHNSSDSEETISLLAVDDANLTIERNLVLPSRTTQFHSLNSLFSRSSNLTLRIRGSSQVKVSYSVSHPSNDPNTTAPALTTPVKIANMSDQLSIQLAPSQEPHRVVIATPDAPETISFKLKFLDGDRLIDGGNLTLVQGNAFQFTPSTILPGISPGLGGTLLIESSEGRLAGYALTTQNQRIRSLTKANQENITKQSPLQTKLLASLGTSNQYQQFETDRGDLIAAGASGVLIKQVGREARQLLAETDVRHAFVEGNELWVLRSRTLEVRHAENGSLIHQMPQDFNATRMVKHGNLLYLWNPFLADVQIFHVQDTFPLSKKETLRTQGESAFDILVQNNMIYVSTTTGLQSYTFEAEGPTSYLGNLNLGSNVRQLSTDGEFLYTRTFSRLFKLEPSPSAQPIVVEEHRPEGSFQNMQGGLALFSDFRDNRIWFIHLIDGAIQELGFLPEDEIIGDLIFNNNTLWVQGFDGSVVEYRIPPNGTIEEVTRFAERTLFIHVERSKDRTFATEHRKERVILHQIQQLDGRLEIISSWDLGEGFSTGLLAVGDILYVSDRDQGLITMDVTPGQEPQRIFSNPGNSYGIVGNDRFIITLEETWRIRIHDLQSPGQPTIVSDFPGTGDFIFNMELDGHLLLLSDFTRGLQIWDLSDPKEPIEAGQVNTSKFFLNATTLDVAFYNQHAYMADSTHMSVVDYRDPYNPVLVNRIPVRTQTVEVLDSYLFTSSFIDSLVYDISNAHSPMVISSSSPLNGNGVLDGTTWWIADGSHVQALDFQPVRATIPWVASNAAFQTQLQIANRGDHPTNIRLRAITPDGTMQVVNLNLPPNSERTRLAGDLFPELKGYALRIETESTAVDTSFTTIARASNGAEQATAQSPATPTHQLKDGLVFNFPAGSHTAAFAVLAPLNQTLQPIKVRIYGERGLIVEGDMILEEMRPSAKLLRSIFPFLDTSQALTLTVTSTNGTVLNGTTFVFNEAGRPATTGAMGESAIYLDPPPRP